MENYSPIKRNELLIYLMTWMNLKCIMLNEKRHKKQHNVLCYLYEILERKNNKDRNLISGCKGP